MQVCVFMYIINNSKGVGVARQETTRPTLPPQEFEFLVIPPKCAL